MRLRPGDYPDVLRQQNTRNVVRSPGFSKIQLVAMPSPAEVKAGKINRKVATKFQLITND